MRIFAGFYYICCMEMEMYINLTDGVCLCLNCGVWSNEICGFLCAPVLFTNKDRQCIFISYLFLNCIPVKTLMIKAHMASRISGYQKHKIQIAHRNIKFNQKTCIVYWHSKLNHSFSTKFKKKRFCLCIVFIQLLLLIKQFCVVKYIGCY